MKVLKKRKSFLLEKSLLKTNKKKKHSSLTKIEALHDLDKLEEEDNAQSKYDYKKITTEQSLLDSARDLNVLATINECDGPFYIASNGEVLKVNKNWDSDYGSRIHTNFIYRLFDHMLDMKGLSYNQINKIETNKLLSHVEGNVGFIRANFGSSHTDRRSYITINYANRPTNAQYDKILEFIDKLYQANKSEVLVYIEDIVKTDEYNFTTTDFDSKIYVLAEHIPEDIVQKIKRGIATGNLVENLKEENSGDGAIWKGKKFWIGAINSLDNQIEEVHSYKEAEANDFHHSFYFSDTAVEKINDEEWSVFWIEKGQIILHWRNWKNQVESKVISDIEKQITFLNKMNEDVQLEVDSQGNELSQKQSEFFKDSQVRDKNNRLLVVYHGTTKRFENEVFNSSTNWFSSNPDYVRQFATLSRDNKEGGHKYLCYLNAVNLFDCGLTDDSIFVLAPITTPYTFSRRFKQIVDKLNIDDKILREVIDEVAKFYKQSNKGYAMKIHLLTRSNQFKDLLVKQGYDGIRCIEQGNSVTFGIFNANQIKSIDNKHPTNSNNINESEQSEKTLTREEVEGRVMNELGTSSKPIDGPSYIMRNGLFLKIWNANININKMSGSESFSGKAQHIDVDGYIDTHIQQFRGNYYLNHNCIRVNTDFEEYMVMPEAMPNSKQFDSLLKWLDYYFLTHSKIHVLDRRGTQDNRKVYYAKDTLPEDIIKKIKRYYSTGKLVEKNK
jgi:hypothetical protein